MFAIEKQIIGRLGLVVAVVVAALAMASAASASELPRQWDPRTVAVNHDAGNSFLLRPGQILAGPGDAADVQRVLTGWRQGEQRPFGLTVFTRAPQTADPAKEVLDALAKVRKATAGRPQGPAQVAPNHVFVGEARGAAAINFYGEPRLQGGPGSSVRPAPLPAALPLRTTARRRPGRADRRARHRHVRARVADETSSARPTAPTCGTSSATATATTSPATARSSPA